MDHSGQGRQNNELAQQSKHQFPAPKNWIAAPTRRRFTHIDAEGRTCHLIFCAVCTVGLFLPEVGAMHLAGLILGWTLLGSNVHAVAAMPDRSPGMNLAGAKRLVVDPPVRRPTVTTAGRGGRPGGASIRPPSLTAGDLRPPGRTDRRRRRRKWSPKPCGCPAARSAASRWNCWRPFRRASIAASNMRSCSAYWRLV